VMSCDFTISSTPVGEHNSNFARVCGRYVMIYLYIVDLNLVGGLNPSEKYESQLGLLFPIYGKIKFIFQTTNETSNGFSCVFYQLS
jgi:hypothetical protein